MKTDPFLILPSWLRFTRPVGCGALLCLAHAFGALLQASEPLPVLLRGAGNWLDRTGAVERLNLVLPVEGQPLVLTNSWIQGSSVLASDEHFFSGVLLLSNVWTYASNGLPEDAFWRAQGVTNAPLKLAIPGERGYYLLVANNRVLPFIKRGGTMAPDAIWVLPKLPVKIKGNKEGTADISQCSGLDFENDTVHVHGWLGGAFGIRQRWHLSVSRGLLCLELIVSPERDY